MSDIPPAPAPPEPGSPYRPFLHALACLMVLGSFILIAVGGNVTSLDAGMAVPDWPGTFGYNMFLAPLNVWFDKFGAFWEHSHRLTGAAVGFITIALALWLWVTQRRRPWLRWLGVTLLGMVIIQGLMGGFRVTENSVFLAGVHGVFGQIVLIAALLAAAATGQFWRAMTAETHDEPVEPQPWFRPELGVLLALPVVGLIASVLLGGRDNTSQLKTWSWLEVGGIWTVLMGLYMVIALGRLGWALTKVRRSPGRRTGWTGPKVASAALLGVLVVQLILGAAVRHSGAEKAIPDAPLVYGSLVPPNTPEQLQAAAGAMPPALQPPPDTTVGQVHLHYAHRVMALGVVGVLAWLLGSLLRSRSLHPAVVPPLIVVLGLVFCQIMLGVMTVWSGIYPTMATMHQATGAALLAFVAWLTIRIHLTASLPAAQESMNRYNAGPAPALSSGTPKQTPA